MSHLYCLASINVLLNLLLYIDNLFLLFFHIMTMYFLSPFSLIIVQYGIEKLKCVKLMTATYVAMVAILHLQ